LTSLPPCRTARPNCDGSDLGTTYSSNVPQVAEVDRSGLVTAVSSGTTTVFALKGAGSLHRYLGRNLGTPERRVHRHRAEPADPVGADGTFARTCPCPRVPSACGSFASARMEESTGPIALRPWQSEW
jgi:hypothetical protein